VAVGAAPALRLAVDPPFSLWTAALLHGWYALAPFRWLPECESLERVDRLPSGAVFTVRLRAAPDLDDGRRGIDLEANPTPSAGDARELAARARRMLRLDEDLTDFHARCRRSRALRPVARSGAGRLLRSPDLWEDAIKGICTTNVTWERTKRMVAALTMLGPKVDGTSARAFPTPTEVLEAGSDFLTQEAGAGYRARSMLKLAESVADGTIDLSIAENPDASSAERLAALEALPGIGPITAGYLAMLLGSYDTLTLDSSTRAFAVRTFGEAAADPKQLARHYSRFGRWRALAFWCQRWVTGEQVRARLEVDQA
jgi:N-glycosylase/DNA lyase